MSLEDIKKERRQKIDDKHFKKFLEHELYRSGNKESLKKRIDNIMEKLDEKEVIGLKNESNL